MKKTAKRRDVPMPPVPGMPPIRGWRDHHPLKFDLRALLDKARRLPVAVDGISISLPFLSVTLKPNQTEKKIAREIVIRISDKRVLNSSQCCESCIRAACESLQEIRKLLVDKQVELADRTDSGLYLLTEFVLEAIRQFLTLTETLDARHDKDAYIEALATLRRHILRCLSQIALIADIKIPKISEGVVHELSWDKAAYVPPAKPDRTTDAVEIFCRQVRARSAENRQAMRAVRALPGQMVPILRQELDSMVRVMYLLSQKDREYRRSLIEATVSGKKWTHLNSRKPVTDREMVDLSATLHGWSKSVYSFGCAFIHLSNLHDYRSRDPLGQLPDAERAAIIAHLRQYHGGPSGNSPTFNDVVHFLPMVFEKIAGNLECYVEHLENGECLDE